MRNTGRQVPDDVRLIGCDDLPLGGLMDPPLSTISLRIDELAKAITDMLFRLLDEGSVPEENRAVAVRPELIVRASS